MLSFFTHCMSGRVGSVLCLDSRTSPFNVFLVDDRDANVPENRYKRGISDRTMIVVAKILNKMRDLLGFAILVTCLTVCLANCQPGLNGLDNWYQCEGLNNLNVIIYSQKLFSNYSF